MRVGLLTMAIFGDLNGFRDKASNDDMLPHVGLGLIANE